MLRRVFMALAVSAVLSFPSTCPLAVAQSTRVSVTFMGAWSSSVTYTINDQVTFSGGLFNSLVANNTTSPVANTTTTQWQFIATQSSTGASPATSSSLGTVQLPSGASSTTLGSAAFQSASAFDAAGAAAAAQSAAIAAGLQKSNNLSDLPNAATARASLGLGTAATANTGAFDAAGAATSAVAGVTPASIGAATTASVTAAQAAAQAASVPLAGGTMTGPLALPKLNSTTYVAATIQAAVTAACTAGLGKVVIQSGASPSDTVAAVTGGCTAVSIVDERDGQAGAKTYTWNSGSSLYALGTGGNGTSVFGQDSRVPAVLSSGAVSLGAGLTPTSGNPLSLYLPNAWSTTAGGLFYCPPQSTTIDAQNKYSSQCRQATTSDIASSATPPASGLAALYNFTGGSLADISGNNAGAIVNGVSGANLATYTSGIGYTCNDSGITYSAQCIMVTPFQSFRGFMATYCQPAASLTSGSTSNTLAPQFPTLLAANNTGVGLRIANSPYYSGAPNSYYSGNAVQPLMFNSATNGGITGANEVFGNCVHLAYSVGLTTDSAPNNVDRIWVNGVERTPYRVQGASSSIVTLTGSNFYELMDYAGLSTFGMRGAIVDTAFKAGPLSQTDVSTHLLWQESLKNTSPLLAARFNPPTVPGIVPNLFLDCDSIFAGLFQTTAWYTQLTLNKTYNVVPAGMAGELGISCAANFDTKAAPYLRVPGSVYVHLAGANDASVGRSVADLAQSDFLLGAKLNAIGARGVMATMLSSSNTTPAAGQFAGGTFDAYKVAINTQRRNNMGNWVGWSKLADLAGAPALGGNGNASNASCFNGGLHPISTGSVVTIGSTTYSCSQAMAVIVSGAINDMDGYTLRSPRAVTAGAYTMVSGDGAISETPTASAAITADDCLQASDRAILNNAASGSGFNLTFTAVNSETISGNAVVAPSTTGIFRSMVTGGSASTTGGCFWQRVQ